MRASRLFVAVFVIGLSMRAAPARAQSSSPPAQDPVSAQALREEIEQLKKDFEARIASLEARLVSAGGEPGQLPAPQAPTPEVSPPVEPPQTTPDVPQGQSLAGASKVFNPDTAVIGNFVGVGGKNALSDQPPLSMSEVELSLQAIVDPYARADFFLSATPEGLEVEEGFITFTALPASFLLKVGKMRASFGKVNPTHSHVMPTSDRPLVTENLVGGEEGLSDAGLSLSKLILNPVMYVEAIGEVYRGDSEVFQSDRRSRLNYLGRIRAYRDLTEGTNLDLGTSFTYGPTDLGSDANKQLVGVDATFRYRPLRRSIYRQFRAQTELIWSRQDIPAGDRQRAFGFYGLGDYQFARRWFLGARYDQSERTVDASLKDTGGSFFVTFWPSEFSQIRTQFRRTNYAEGVGANEVLFQFRFGIGAHAAHVF